MVPRPINDVVGASMRQHLEAKPHGMAVVGLHVD